MDNLWCTPKPLLGYTDTQTKNIPDKDDKKEIDKPSASITQHVLPEDAQTTEDQVNDSPFMGVSGWRAGWAENHWEGYS